MWVVLIGSQVQQKMLSRLKQLSSKITWETLIKLLTQVKLIIFSWVIYLFYSWNSLGHIVLYDIKSKPN